MKLTSGQIRRLRAEGHRLKLKPVITVGQRGLTDSLHAEIDGALDRHELLKLRIPPLERTARRAFADSICELHRAVLVENIGGVIVIYRRNGETDRFATVVGPA